MFCFLLGSFIYDVIGLFILDFQIQIFVEIFLTQYLWIIFSN